MAAVEVHEVSTAYNCMERLLLQASHEQLRYTGENILNR
jgi:hypothetical protein